ncbi:MAG: hypothetical protein O2967_06335 [Proteobacteria bacterium]|nr:hypothetical protein [Pseudomonadota bacterium]
MKQISKSAAAAIVGLGALALLATPGFAAGGPNTGTTEAPARLAHMTQGEGKMGEGMMQPGSGGQGKMGEGMMRPGSGGQGMMGQGMMRPGSGGQGMMGPGSGKGMGLGHRVVPVKHLTADEVRHFLEHRLEMRGNKRLKVGEVKDADDDKIVADITTVDGSLVRRLEVDRHSGEMKYVE